MSVKHAALRHPPSDLVGGEWVGLPSGKGAVMSRNPARPEQVVWDGVARAEHVDTAVAAARKALPGWSRWGHENRYKVLKRFAALCKERSGAIAELISDETGKVMWEAKGEASALAAKVDITLDATPVGALKRVESYEIEVGPQKIGRAWFRPHGVMAVLGPFNFPAHLPNGHIVPALAMGNTVVFKPSDKAPGVGQMLVELFNEALVMEGAPGKGAGIVNLVQGGAEIAKSLVRNDGVDGILFTGSWPVGRAILEANLDRPGRIVALEMGGNNPAVVLDDADLRQAAIEIVRCAFNTTGQRCTCTRRVVVEDRAAVRLIPALVEAAKALVIGDPRSSTPVFTGPIINEAARKAVLDAQKKFAKQGGEVLLEARAVEMKGACAGGYFVSPGIVQVEEFSADEAADAGSDVEIFGPLLRVCEVKSVDEAIRQANATRFGLAASIFTTSQESAQRFLAEARAGCVNVNTGTAGASSKLPFGGVGLSGNHRPAGSFSLDYCAYPVAGMIEKGTAAQVAEGMKWEERWLG